MKKYSDTQIASLQEVAAAARMLMLALENDDVQPQDLPEETRFYSHVVIEALAGLGEEGAGDELVALQRVTQRLCANTVLKYDARKRPKAKKTAKKTAKAKAKAK